MWFAKIDFLNRLSLLNGMETASHTTKLKDDQVQDPLSSTRAESKSDFTLHHAYYSNMGGLRLLIEVESNPPEETDVARTRTLKDKKYPTLQVFR